MHITNISHNFLKPVYKLLSIFSQVYLFVPQNININIGVISVVTVSHYTQKLVMRCCNDCLSIKYLKNENI